MKTINNNGPIFIEDPEIGKWYKTKEYLPALPYTCAVCYIKGEKCMEGISIAILSEKHHNWIRLDKEMVMFKPYCWTKLPNPDKQFLMEKND